MARITVEDCLEHVNNRFALVLLVAKRTKQLMKGATCTAPGKNNKRVVNSLREVAAQNVYFDYAEDLNGPVINQIEDDLNR